MAAPVQEVRREPTADELRDLARRMSKVDKVAAKKLAVFLDGHTDVRLAMPTAREQAHRLAYDPNLQIPFDLRRDLKAWLSDYGKPRGGEKEAKKRLNLQLSQELLAALAAAADLYGVSMAEFARGAIAKHVEEALGRQ